MDQTGPLVIDGQMHEGGGQILRISLALSVILQKPFKIVNIRKSRPNPGLNNQLKSVVPDYLDKQIQLVTQIAKANVVGDSPGSQEITFEPIQGVDGGTFQCGFKSAASTGLMFQCLLPILLFAKQVSYLTLQGGTTVSQSPPSQSIEKCLLPLLRLMGIAVEYKVVREGYFPVGNGSVKVTIQPCKDTIKPISLVQKTVVKECHIRLILTKDLPFKQYVKDIVKTIQQSQLQPFSQLQQQPTEEQMPVHVTSQIITCKKFKEAYGVIVNALCHPNVYDSSLILMEDMSLDTLMNKVNDKLAHELQSDSCLDEFHQDQLLIFMSLAQGTSEIRVGPVLSEHILAALYVLQKFIPSLVVETLPSQKSTLIRITGIAKQN